MSADSTRSFDMRLLSLSVLVLGLTLVSYGAMADCPGHGVAQKPASTTVATADAPSPQSTKIKIPAPKTGG
jgi:hypothetical protein